jgi:antitoxin PrlF
MPFSRVWDGESANTTTAKVTSKGQITIPANVRQALQVRAGDQVEFVKIAPGRFEIIAVMRSVRELRGMFGEPTTAVSVDDMNKAIAERGAAS